MKTLRTVLIASLAALIAACGGGTGGTGVTGTPAVSIGVMTKGSVIVNGVHFEDNTAQITIDDTPKLPADLQSGMVVKVRGQINDDQVTGTAQQVKAISEVRGTVQTHNSAAIPPTFTVVGQTVFVDDLTVFANFSTPTPSPAAAVSELVDASTPVEVHGLRDASGNIRASRVENLTLNPPLPDELRGTVASLLTTTFTLQNGTANVSVTYTAGMISPVGATLTNGALVEVHGAFSVGTFAATRVDVEAAEDTQFQHVTGEEFEIEGQITGCGNADPCSSFLVANQAVQTNTSTRFENGAAADIADNVGVEAEGHQFTGTTLIAEKITFKRTRVILNGIATVTGSIPGTGTLQVLGKTVQTNSLTQFDASGGVITTGERVEVRGFTDSSGIIVAERVDDSPSGGNKDAVQARVTAKAGNVLTLLVGTTTINADLTNATQFSDTNEQPIPTLTAFLAAVTPAPAPGGTLVKVKGTFSAGTIAVEEAELEN